jgi:hypothetical protein
MTYPPQGPYGQQPDPYGQQQPQQPQPPQQPQYGGYPQQQQPQYGGYDPNTQQQYAGYDPTQQQAAYDPNAAQYGGGYGQQYGGFGGGPQPPKSNKGPIIAVVSIVVLILAGVGITGFVAPGFFLSDDKGGNNTANGGSSNTKPSTPENAGADEFLEKLVAAADEKDKTALTGFQCSDASDGVKGATDDINEIESAELKDTREKSDTEVVATLSIVVDGSDGDYDVTVVKDGGDWCWKDIESAGGSSSSEETTTEGSGSSEAVPPATGGTDGEKFVQSFLDKLNAGDGAGAAALSCSDSTSQSDITEAATQSPQLQMDPAGTTADSSYVGADLKGTLGGAEASGRTSAFLEDGKWCIYTFFAS